VTRFGVAPAAALRAAARLSLGSRSSEIEVMRVSCHLHDMIAPTDRARKRPLHRYATFSSAGSNQDSVESNDLLRSENTATSRHGIVSGIHNTAPLPPI